MVNTTRSEHSAGPLYSEIAKLVPLSVLIVITNVLVVVLFFKRRYLHTLANYPLFSLAVCDFITGFVNIPLLIISMHTLTWDVGSKQTRTYLSYLVLVLHALTSTSTVYHILVVIVEKYFAIVWPLKHRLLTKKRDVDSIGGRVAGVLYDRFHSIFLDKRHPKTHWKKVFSRLRDFVSRHSVHRIVCYYCVCFGSDVQNNIRPSQTERMFAAETKQSKLPNND